MKFVHTNNIFVHVSTIDNINKIQDVRNIFLEKKIHL